MKISTTQWTACRTCPVHVVEVEGGDIRGRIFIECSDESSAITMRDTLRSLFEEHTNHRIEEVPE